MLSTPQSAKSLFVKTQDGLQLHVREYGDRHSAGLPVVCLPGLSRTVADFDALAPALSQSGGMRRVIPVDSLRGGRSDYDTNPANYNVGIELADLMTVLSVLAVGPAIFVGSSRGGILTMLLAATNPSAVAAAVLHDIGPVIEPAGLVRIKGYLG